jgi:hypothetical protein
LTSQQVEKFSFENWISGSKTKGKKFLVATKSFVSPDCLVNMRLTNPDAVVVANTVLVISLHLNHLWRYKS